MGSATKKMRKQEKHRSVQTPTATIHHSRRLSDPANPSNINSTNESSSTNLIIPATLPTRLYLFANASTTATEDLALALTTTTASPAKATKTSPKSGSQANTQT
jgi:hypothetical protein